MFGRSTFSWIVLHMINILSFVLPGCNEGLGGSWMRGLFLKKCLKSVFGHTVIQWNTFHVYLI